MTTLPPPPDHPTVRLSSPPDIVRAIPSLLGFHPGSSLVALGLTGRRLRLRVTVRADLPPPGLEAAVADQVAARLRGEKVSACVVVLFTATSDAGPRAVPGPRPAVPASRGRASLPGADVAYAAEQSLRKAGLDVREMLRAESGRWWSYTCAEPCCPPEGLPVGPAPTTLLDVLRVAAGRPVFADRPALVASVGRHPGEPTDALLAAIHDREAVLTGLRAGTRAARDLVDLHNLLIRDTARLAVPPDSAVPDSTSARPAIEGPAPAATAPAPPETRAHDDRTIAQVAVGLTHRAVRDACFAWTGGPLAEAATALWDEMVRRVPAPYGAAPATLLAVSAYRRGDGALADACLRRALDDDPDYRMAELVLTGLENGFGPADVEAALGLDGEPDALGPAREVRWPGSGSAPSPSGGTDAR
ncbi:DUF4192 domain-containing protein [Cryptosporangium arvum]|uniref:DUF4192 domain-containing protein n=1 Tax=Cryptosporangium arvum TaxID=80871 RepID=UPI0012EDFB11|nr:DUF4192 domain-containing protein [Cryptosporangium arvum]